MVSQGKKQGSWIDIEQVLRESESRAAAGQFSAAIMHEINNPLESISNLAYLVEQEADNPAKVREYIVLLRGEVANVIRIARQTLSFYKPSDGRSPVNLVAVAESALRVHESRIAAKQIHLIKDLADEVRIEVHPGEMLQVFSNLLGNALDALPDNGTLSLRIRERHQNVHITIADDGQGIPEKVLLTIFDPFFTTKKENGTGLGLTLSKSIIEGHNGKIRVRSSTRPGRRGSAFRISLPLNRNGSKEGKPKTRCDGSSGNNAGKGNVVGL
jgi:signal transduction histidine kinase